MLRKKEYLENNSYQRLEPSASIHQFCTNAEGKQLCSLRNQQLAIMLDDIMSEICLETKRIACCLSRQLEDFNDNLFALVTNVQYVSKIKSPGMICIQC